MIDAKQAIHIAKTNAAELLGQSSANLEEIERETYNGDDVWSITLSFLRDQSQVSAIRMLSNIDRLDYKRFLINVETGELVAMKLREVASQ